METNEKPFDAVRLMREIRDQLNQELEGKGFEELKRHIRERVELSKATSRSSAV